MECQLDFKEILFCPKYASFDMFEGGAKKMFNHIILYDRQLILMDNCENIMSEWPQFVKGVIDSGDFPLNISQEILQQNKILCVIQKKLVKKCKENSENLSENKDSYKKFYEAFSTNLKLGNHMDSTNSSKISKLMKYHLTKSGEEMTSLDDYISCMYNKHFLANFCNNIGATRTYNLIEIERLHNMAWLNLGDTNIRAMVALVPIKVTATNLKRK
eukprot:11885582-Ditylum_brightwellii.AAC.1